MPNNEHAIHDASAQSRRSPLLKQLVMVNGRPITARERTLSHALLVLEDIIKVPLFRCQRCGECILSSTAFICSQNCPKRLRNGPCGGTGEGGSCEVFPDRKCVWYRIYFRSRLLHRVSLLYKVNRIHNWNLEKTSAWLNLFRGRIQGSTLFLRNDTQRVKDIISDDAAEKA
jgi:methylenetetrahydrofolate reductase (NADPH)